MYDEPDFLDDEQPYSSPEVSDEAPKYPRAVNMSLDLEAICIGIRSEIVQATAHSIYQDLCHKVVDEVRKLVRTEIEAQLTAIVSEALSGRIQPTDEWGEPTGEQTTVRDMLREKAAKFLDEQVDYEGKTSSYSSNKHPRWKWALSSLVDNSVKGALKSEMDSIVAAMQEKLKAELPGVLADSSRKR